MPGVEVVLRYEQILHTLQTAVDDGEKKYTAELNATMGRGSKSAGDLIKIIFADFMPALLQVSISVALAATVFPQFAARLREIHRMRDEANEATIHVAKPSRYSTIRSIHASFGRRLARM
jgi:hypothetical protein